MLGTDSRPTAGIVAGRPARAESGTTFRSFCVAEGVDRSIEFSDALPSEAAAAAEEAEAAFIAVQTDETGLDPAELLRDLAAALEDRRADLVAIASLETGLTEVRLNSELSRTTSQIALLASETVARSGVVVEQDPASDGGFVPALALGYVPIGPVAVFGASNFPFAFGVLGGDTAAALAAGCPVVAKGHPAHPETSQLLAEILTRVLADGGWPRGWFSLLHGRGSAIGQALVAADGISALAFTGSTRTGLALAAVAAARSVPIPVFAELGGINALYLLPAAADAASEKAAHADAASEHVPPGFIPGLAASVMGGSGQFCTKPGLLVLVDDAASRRVVSGLTEALAGVESAPMLTPGIRHSLVNGAHRLASLEGVEVLLHGPTDGAAAADPVPSFLATVSSAALRAHPTIADELFGPALVVVYCENVDDLIDLTRTIPGGLTATIHAAPADAESSLALLRRLRLRVGRILFGGFPTGVRVGRATNHGGPFPATTAPSTTSVGVRSIDRFLRPVTYQDLPQPWFEPAMAWM